MEPMKNGQLITPMDERRPERAARLEGIGGWLLMPAFGVIVAPLRTLQGTVVDLIQPLLAHSAIISPRSPTFSYRAAGLASFELLANLALIVVGIWLAWLFFRKAKETPKWFYIAAGLGIAIQVVDLMLYKLLFPELPPQQAAEKQLGTSVVACAIWLPYFHLSVRVKNTFVR